MQTVNFFRPCGECTGCCAGQIAGDIYNFKMGLGKKCAFLIKNKCSIYENRPNVCKNYQCAWSQQLFDQDFRPDKSGFMVSIEIDSNNIQYFKVIEVKKNIPKENYEKMQEYTKLYDTYMVLIPYIDTEE